MIKEDKNKIDMLNGSLVDKLIIFAIPLALTSTLQQLFNAADIVVCGRFVGNVALAAVGANSQIVNLFVNAFLGLAVGSNVMIANYIGAGKKEKIHNVVHTAMSFAMTFGLALMIIGLFFARNILLFLGTPDDILIPATIYLRIMFIGIPFMVIYNFGAAILRSIGDTKRPLIILTITGILNVILNVVFVVVFNLGVVGVAISTAFANFINAIIVTILLMKEKSEVHYDIKTFMINIDALGKIMKIGVPSAIQGMVFSLSNLCVQSAVNSLGTKTIAANTAALNLEVYPFYIFTAFTSACLTFMSQNFGAKQYERCKQVIRDCIILGAVFSFILMVIMEINAKTLLGIFTLDEEVIEIAMVRVRFVASVSWTQVLYDCCGAGLRALKHPMISTVMVILGTVVFRVIWCLTVFPLYKNYFTVALAYPLSWLLINITMAISYIVISKKMLRDDAAI